MNLGGLPGNGFSAISDSVRGSFWRSFATKLTNQGSWYQGVNPQNHMSQSSRRWYGAIWGGVWSRAPGFALNPYSRHTVSASIESADVPSTTTSYLGRVMEPNAP